ncbi:ABC transporter ATP-binding protein [uncultured Roseovarius sp.]|uniref:ABC transporter ATP-binding protein n=1 Tax=uncultured Roseovarius sp. TaxID=293344 RepID=UPI002622A6A7|nr:ABC transporter ATP-binding protein [uncultured Roseovarius sp.]
MARKDKHPVFRPQDKDNIRWFWQNYLRSKSPWLLLVFGMVSCQALVYQQFLSLTENSLNVIFEGGSPQELIKVCAIVFLLFAVRAALSYIVPRLSAWLASNAVRKMRQDLINHYLNLDLSYFERTKSGDIILRLVNQVDGLSTFVGQGTVNAVRDTVTIIVVSGYLVYKSPILFSAAIIVIPALALVMRSVSSKIKHVQQSAENAFGSYMSGIEEMANGMRTVKISGQEDRERDRLFQATDGIRDLLIRLNAAQALFEPSIDLVSAFVYVLVIGGGGYMVIQGDFGIDAAGIIAFLLGLVILFDPMRLLAGFFAQLQASLILLEGIRSVYSQTPRIVNRENAVSEFDTKGDIVFEGVDFSYDSQKQLFKNLSFEIIGGKTTAIVGATGSGKTTILSLITRLYDLDGGQISIGGLDIRDIQIKKLRSSFSVVAQDIVIFNASIWDNIAYVRPDASDEEIWAAAESAEIADLMRERGHAELGPKGSQLSGGQKQRIAIARAFLRASPIVILDEATSALDQKTEQRIQSALERLADQKTVIIVAHRLSSVANADKIYVFDHGSIVEQGNHEELVEQKGLYAGMYSSQKGGFR